MAAVSGTTISKRRIRSEAGHRGAPASVTWAFVIARVVASDLHSARIVFSTPTGDVARRPGEIREPDWFTRWCDNACKNLHPAPKHASATAVNGCNA